MGFISSEERPPMYIPTAFREERADVLRDLIRSHPLATLVTAGVGGMMANLIPFVVESTPAGDVLRAHLARANDQVADLREAEEAMVIFQGPDAYITPSWYPTNAEHGRVVPTWNYVTVHVWGRPTLHDEPEWLLAQIGQLTDSQETARAVPWAVTDAPDAYIAAQLRGIVGLEIPITRIEGKWKVSQNQPAANRDGIASGLSEQGSPVAELVRRGRN